MSKNLFVKTEPYVAYYDDPEDPENSSEFIRDVSAEIRETNDDPKDPSDEETTLARIFGTIVRISALIYGPGGNPLETLDVEQSVVPKIGEFLRNADDDAFMSEFDYPPDCTTVLSIDKIVTPVTSATSKPLDVLETRQLVRRFAEQFDVDLVFIDAASPFAEHFRNYFKPYTKDGSFLIYSTAHHWPTDMKDQVN